MEPLTNEISICGIFVWMEWKLNWKQKPNLMNINAGVRTDEVAWKVGGIRYMSLHNIRAIRIRRYASVFITWNYWFNFSLTVILEFQMEILAGANSLIRLLLEFVGRKKRSGFWFWFCYSKFPASRADLRCEYLRILDTALVRLGKFVFWRLDLRMP